MSIPFHRLAHSTRINPAKPARWWHPLTEIAVFVVAGLALTGLWSVVAYWLADLMMHIILMIPAALIAARWGGRRVAGFLWSVAGRIRWGLLWRSFPPVIAIYAVYGTLSLVIDGADGIRIDQHALIMLGVIFALVPLQAAAEELIFRAWLPQLIGTWVTSPWLPYLVSLPIFMIGHEYGIKGQIDVAVFAICAAIVIHVVGNVVAFSLETIGVYESVTSDAGFTWTAIACSVAVTVASTAVLLRMHRREYGRAFTNAPATNRPTITRPAGQPDAPRESAAMDAHVR